MPANVITMYSNGVQYSPAGENARPDYRRRAHPGAEGAETDYPRYAETDASRYRHCRRCRGSGRMYRDDQASAPYDNPIYIIEDVVHYCVANMPGAVPFTSTVALTNATLPYALQLANKGWQRACAENNELKLGLNVVKGKIVYQGVTGEAFNLPFDKLEAVLATE